ncbi:MAG TPA: lasso peptide biosynthesis B2 protein [Pyrinomonadaceae bacterium]|nr:lasso peptide biosynthesis B2 protein [Pyrinomonadaceae bacterium]
MILTSLFWLAYYRFGLWVSPSGVTKRAIDDAADDVLPRQTIDKALLSEIVRSVRRCSRYVPFASCLTQALAAKRILRSYGTDSRVKIGVAAKDSSIEAHAWLEVEDKIVLGRVAEQARFSVMTSRPHILQ